jgi:tRNA 2-selenouridine synthase
MTHPRLIVLSGLAGVGKTAALNRLAAHGQTTLDLEGLARHRGSAFGGLGLPAQPRHDDFQQAVRAVVVRSLGERLWVEDEGDYIGSVGLPAELVGAMRDAPRVELTSDRHARVDRLVAEYGGAPPAEWLKSIDAAAPRLGDDRAARARAAVRAGDFRGAVDAVLDYYDHAYRHRAAHRHGALLAVVDADAPASELVSAATTCT